MGHYLGKMGEYTNYPVLEVCGSTTSSKPWRAECTLVDMESSCLFEDRADLSYSYEIRGPRGPRHWRSCPPSLAARSNVQSFTRKCAEVSGTTCCCCRSARPTDITLWWHQSSDGSMVPSVRRSTVGDRAFTVAGPRVLNTLPEEITTSQTLSTFRQQLKTWLFRKSYPDIIIWTSSLYTLYN